MGSSCLPGAVLYNIIYQTTEVFGNNCSILKGRGMQDENNNNKQIEPVETNYKLFPVPNNGSFYLEGSFAAGDKLSIFTPEGKTVFDKELDNSVNKLLIDSELNSGIYFVLVRSKEGLEQFKSKIVIIE